MDNEVKKFIDSQDTKFARTYREKAKFLVAATLPSAVPPIQIWDGVLKAANGM